jgi:hypothetical protein
MMNSVADQVIVDYTSSAGQTVTHARGSNVVRYIRPRRPDPNTLAISCSWV